MNRPMLVVGIILMMTSFYGLVSLVTENNENILLHAKLNSCENQLDSMKARCH